MKSKFMYLAATACMATAFTSCNDDDNDVDIIDGSGTSTERVEDATVQLRIKQSISTYASVTDIDATPEESTITGPVDIYVFDDAGIFEKSVSKGITFVSSTPGTGDVYQTDTFMLSSGTKYFYVLTNGMAPNTQPTSGSTRASFETQVLNKTVDDITKDDKFYIGTLVGQTTTVNSVDDAQTISLDIGRLAAKVVLKESSKNANVAGNLKGTMSAPEFRLVNIPSKFYLIGQWDRGFRQQGSQVRAPYYLDYTPRTSNFSDVTTAAWPSSAKGPGGYEYTIENTNEDPKREAATAMQLQYVYTPAASEIYDVADPRNNGTLNGTTFWTAEFENGTRLIYNGDPTTMDHPDYGIPTKVAEYTNGLSYYTVYIADNSEGTPSLKYAVIRNHYYELTVNNIYRLGNNTPDITDPTEPVEKEVEIDIEITVLPWFYIGQEVDL